MYNYFISKSYFYIINEIQSSIKYLIYFIINLAFAKSLLQLTWFKNGQRIRDSQRVETSYSNQQATLRIRVALPEDSGHYTLLSENPQGCTVSSAYLAIESSDQVDQVPYQTHQREFIKTQQIESTTESTDSSKVLPPNFVRTITDKEATEGKMTRYVSTFSIFNISLAFLPSLKKCF